MFKEKKKKLTVTNWLILCTRPNFPHKTRVSSSGLQIVLLERKSEDFPGKSVKIKIVTLMHECVSESSLESAILISSVELYAMDCLN